MIRFILAAFAVVLSAVLAALASPMALAQGTDWPTKPVKFVSPFPPGGSVDPLARLVAVKMSEVFGQQFIVENKTGASGSIGTAYVAKSPPDGYTYVFVFDTHAVNPTLIPNLPYDTLKMTLLQQAAGVQLVHVPYKGGGPMTTDVLGGQIELAIASVAQQGPHVRGGKLRAVAVTGNTRSPVLPDVPALAEQGFPSFSALAWWGIFAPAGVPRPILDKFHAELVRMLNRPDVRKQLNETLGMDITASSQEDTQRFLITQIERWGKVVRDNNIRME